MQADFMAALQVMKGRYKSPYTSQIINVYKKIVQTKYDVPVRKAHKGNHICLYGFSFYLRSN